MDGIVLMAQAMHAARARLDVSATNLANVSSAGFTRQVTRVHLGPSGLTVSRGNDPATGPLERTGRPFDLAVAGTGAFRVGDRAGAVTTERSATFVLDPGGELRDGRDRALLGARGPLRVTAGTTFDARGFAYDASGRELGRVRLQPGSSLQSGFLERSNVDAVREMVDVLSAQRAFETAQKTLSAIDDTRSKAVNDLGRVA